MTQPAQPPTPPPVTDPTAQQQPPQIPPEARLSMQIGAALAPIVKGVDPHVATRALLRVAALQALQTSFTPEHLGGMVGHFYNENKNAMEQAVKDPRIVALLGIKPGEPPPADIEDRLRKLMQQVQDGTLNVPPSP
jgi:hypothetical protein